VRFFVGGWVEGVVAHAPGSSDLPWGEIFGMGSVWDGWRVVQPIGMATIVPPDCSSICPSGRVGYPGNEKPLPRSELHRDHNFPRQWAWGWQYYLVPLLLREFLILSWATALLRKEAAGCVFVPPFGLWVFCGTWSFICFMVCTLWTSLSLVALHHRCICGPRLSPTLSVDPWQLLFGFWFLTPVDFLAGKFVGCFVHGGVK